jgi:para-nitrobenzyl esterase
VEDIPELGSFYGKEFFSPFYKQYFGDSPWLPPMSENCLLLNIWTPAASAEDKLPVAFWIHGGGFLGGFATEPEFDGAAFAEKGVILVTVGHRVGALGYLSHPALSAEQGGVSGNYGLMDLIAALDWTRDNIAVFGGDRDRITVFGQSAGAMSAQALVSTSFTRNKIRGAIFQSGGGYRAGIIHHRPLAEAEELGKEFTRLAGAVTLDDMRALPSEKILEAQKTLQPLAFGKGLGLPFIPVVDGRIIMGDVDTLAETGAHHDIPYMLGSTANDIGSEMNPVPGMEKPDLRAACSGFSGLSLRLGRKPAYVYYFSQKPLGDDAGAFHSSELWYMFGTLGRSWRPKTESDYELSRRMVGYWTNFIKYGDPNGDELQEWKPCGEDGFVMELQTSK